MSDLFQATKRESAVDIVVNSIKELLMDRKLVPGDRLPSETEISEGLNVSRGSVREAMKILSAFGLIDIRVGNGTYVSESPSSGLLDSLLFTYYVTNPDVENLYEFRQIFEIDIVELTITHYDENEKLRKALKDNLDEMEEMIKKSVSTDKIIEKDMEFHHLLGEACCNPLAARIYYFIMDSLRASISHTHSHQKGELAYKAHKEIYDIIQNKAYDKAADCIRNSVDIWYQLLQE